MNLSLLTPMNPEQGFSLSAAQALRARLNRRGLTVSEICADRRSADGLSTTQQIPEQQLIDAGVDPDTPLNLFFTFFASGQNEHNCALVAESLGQGDIAGFDRMYANLHPGDTLHGWVAALVNIPEVLRAITAVLAQDAPPAAAKKA